MEWERSYIDALIQALRPSGDVLQVGFGSGYAANAIQAFKPKSHTILEPDSNRAAQAREWSKAHPHSTILHETWAASAVRLGAFDAIFFDDPSFRTSRIGKQRQHCREGAEFLHKGHDLLSSIELQFPQMMMTHYSDQDLEHLYNKAGQFHRDTLPRFFAQLKQRGQISEQQYEKALLKYKIPRVDPTPHIVEPVDPLLPFIEECLAKHMRKHGRISWFSCDPVSKYEDPKFLKNIISNVHLDYQEHSVPVHPTPDCDYFEGHVALVSVISKS